MIKIVGIEFIPRLGNGRPENGTGTFVEANVSGAIVTRQNPALLDIVEFDGFIWDPALNRGD